MESTLVRSEPILIHSPQPRKGIEALALGVNSPPLSPGGIAYSPPDSVTTTTVLGSSADSESSLIQSYEQIPEIAAYGEQTKRLSTLIQCQHIANKNAIQLNNALKFRAILKNFMLCFDKHKSQTSCIADSGYLGTALLILKTLSIVLEKTNLPAEERSSLWSETSEAFTSRILTGEITRRGNLDTFTQLLISAHAANPEANTTKTGFKQLISKIYEVNPLAVYSRLRTTLQKEESPDRLATILENLGTLIQENLKYREQVPIFLELGQTISENKSKSIRELKLRNISNIHSMLDGYYVIACHEAKLAEKKELIRAYFTEEKLAE